MAEQHEQALAAVLRSVVSFHHQTEPMCPRCRQAAAILRWASGLAAGTLEPTADAEPVCSKCGEPWGYPHECDSAEKLIAERRAAGLTKVAIARAWGVSKVYVGKVERTGGAPASRRKYREAMRVARGEICKDSGEMRTTGTSSTR